MRPIKFRAWDKIKKRIVPVLGWHRFTGINIGDVDNARCNRYLNDDDFELMQFTGLHDNNGKEIFEWDIVKIYSDNIVIKGYIKGVVEYMPNCAAFYFSHSDGWSSCLNNLVIDYEDIEIIGNIYENHELLENK